MPTTQPHDDTYSCVMWDGDRRVISIEWRQGTSSMTDQDFKSELELFAGLVERKKACGILVDIAHLRLKMELEV